MPYFCIIHALRETETVEQTVSVKRLIQTTTGKYALN